MSEPYCRTCNGWHYPEPVNPCPANQKGFIRPEKPRNPYKGTALEAWFPDIRHTPEQRKEWARVCAVLGGKSETVNKPDSVNTKVNKPVNKAESVNTDVNIQPSPHTVKDKDRKTYMREYMAKKRAEKKEHDDK